MPNNQKPSSPNFIPGVGRLVTDRYDFQAHVDGTSFRHNATQIDLLPSVNIDGYIATTVQSAINIIGQVIQVPKVPLATNLIPGILQLSGDLAGINSSATNPIVSGLQGRPVANLTPIPGQFLVWGGSNWQPSSNIFIGSGGAVYIGPGGAFVLEDGAVFNTFATSTMNLFGSIFLNSSFTANSGSAITTVAGSTLTLSGAITLNSTLNASSTSIVNLNSGSQLNATSANITIGSGSLLTTSSTGTIKSGTAGSIILNGGSTDWVTFASTRSRTITQSPTPLGNASGWSNAGAGTPVWQGPGTNVPQFFAITGIHNGATLSSIVVFLIVKGPHSAVPATLPAIQVYRRVLFNGNTDAGSLVTLNASASSFPTPGSGAAWDNSNLMQSWTYTANQNNVIDTTQYVYFIRIVDENGSNSASGNEYIGFELNYTGIPNMQFP